MGLRKLCLVLLAAFSGMGPTRAAVEQSVDMLPESGVAITLGLGFETFPRAGYMPCRVTIENRSPQSHSWDLTFSASSGSYSQPNRAVLTRALSAKGGETATYDLLIPIYPSDRTNSSYGGPTVMISGDGVRGPMLTLRDRSHSGRETPFLIMSPALATRSWSPLRVRFEKKGSEALMGGEVDLSLLGDDWRALAGVELFFLSDGEYQSLPPGTRHALQSWVAQGGRLVLCGNDSLIDFGGKADDDHVSYHLGLVRRLAWDGSSELDANRILEILNESDHTLGDQLDESNFHWKFAEAIGVSAHNTAFLAIFITLFAVVVGPLNLFWFAGASRRHRLFWTTPLISVVASILLGGVILLQDGFGGQGVRMTLHYLLPETKEALVMQEQASRAGLLLSRRFPAPDDVFLSPMTLPPIVSGWQGKRTIEEGERTFGGGWFLSRSSQAQFAEAIMPSRESVEITAGGPAPVAKSSIAVPLRDLYYIDAEGGFWHAGNVPPGQRVTLERVKSLDRFAAVAAAAGPMLRPALQSLGARRNYFYALAGKSSAIETLPSIRWKDDQSLYLGPVAVLP